MTKATAAHRYLELRGQVAEHAAAIGDAPSDLELADVVGAMILVANGAWAADERRDVIVTEGSAGDGWAEAVSVLLARKTAGPATDSARPEGGGQAATPDRGIGRSIG